ncbi:hypothetical protein JTB14_037823 [Gonioctena quinquepunctata]|nr:hypothetical protein JTB14_037823 [Gonioctena quinquepunctata]
MVRSLYKWFLKQRERNEALAGEMLEQKAQDFHAKIKKYHGKFNTSVEWLQKFRWRYGITLLKIAGQSCSNVQLSTIGEDSCDFNEETNDSTFEQFMNIQQEQEEEIEEDMTVQVDFQEYESDQNI